MMHCTAAVLKYVAATVVLMAAVPAAAQTVVLDTAGYWRMHHTLAPPVFRAGDGLEPLEVGYRFLEATGELDADWTAPAFDDRHWVRMPLLGGMRSPFVVRQHVRGRFRVTDPARVQGLTLSLSYFGGVVVYLNGQELTRAHVGDGELRLDDVADDYPADAFVTDDGSATQVSRVRDGAQRQRILDDWRRSVEIEIPSAMLEPGTNVVAIKVVRAPYDRAVADPADANPDRNNTTAVMPIPSAQLRHARLTAASADGLVPNHTRPRGVQVWNSDPLAPVFDLEWGDPNESLEPIRLTGVRDGIYSGKVVVGSDAPIRELKARVVGDLVGPDGATIAGSAVRVRYGQAWGAWPFTAPHTYERQPFAHPVDYLATLDDQPLDEYPVREKRAHGLDPGLPEPPPAVFGATVPVWVTLRVPADAAPGTYRGELAIDMAGHDARSVPVELEVIDWTLPRHDAARVWVGLIQSPDTLALEYDLEPWSPEHWRMIARSFELMNEVDSSVVYVPLLAQTNLGNEQSMVHWVEQTDGSYEFDYSVMERYLDTAIENLDQIDIICFVVWDIYVDAEQRAASDDDSRTQRALGALDELGDAPLVTALDPSTGEHKTIALPSFLDDASAEPWSRLWAGVRQRLAERDLEDAAALGLISDIRPRREEVGFWADITPGTDWVVHSHFGVGGSRGETPGPGAIHNLAGVAYQSRLWHTNFGVDPEDHYHGWQRPDIAAYYLRSRAFESFPPTQWRHIVEFTAVSSDLGGIGRIGADFWPAVRDSRDRRRGRAWSRYPQSHWRNLDIHTAALAPGNAGPVSTQRYEALREGAQLAEARVYLKSVLRDDSQRGRLDDALLDRIERTLEQRSLDTWRSVSTWRLHRAGFATAGRTWNGNAGTLGDVWYRGSAARHAERKVYDLAAEVAAALE